MGLERNNEQHYREIVDKYHDPFVSFQMNTWDYVLRPSTVGEAITITLPPVSEAKGRFYSIIARTITGNFYITVQDKNDSEGWEGDFVLDAAGEGQLLYSDGLKWMLRTFSDITVLDINKLGGRIYSNPTGVDYTILKIHSHDTTAEIGSLETKGDLINTTGLVLGQANYWTYEPTGLTGAPAQFSASENVGAVSPGYTVTAGNLYGLTGHMQCHGTLDGATVNVAGVIGILTGAGTNTQVLHMAGVQSAVSVVNPTTGTLSHFLANTVGVGVIDNLLCMQASQLITNFASFNQAAADKCVEANTNTLTLTETTFHIRVLIEGTPYYIPCFDSKDWT